MHKDDLISISKADFNDIGYCLLVVSQIVSNKDLTDEEMMRMKFVFKTYSQAYMNISKTLEEYE